MLRAKPKSLAGIGGLLLLLGILPYFLKYHHQDFLIFLIINVLVVVSYRLVTLTGEWSLIHAVMMGVGAYASAILTKSFDLSFWLALPLAGVVAGASAALLSYPLFRMTQFYFLIGSFAAGEAIRLCWIHFIYPFGGTSGISGIPPPELAGIDFLDPISYHYLVMAIVSICLITLYRIEKSHIGLILHAVHWKAPLAESVGVNTWRYRSLAFIIGSFFVGIAGTLKVHYLGTVTPNQFGIGFMVFILIWVIVGGYGKFYGAILGVVILSILDESFRRFDEIRPAIYGAILIASIMFLPSGLESIPTKFRARFFASKPAA
ncbi:MAG: branched-chain amino acid ABC transporter permease [Arenicellales bacterium]|jgi:branched-chain amino acid transport system permease protein|nr:branched-chain amino acid ABC transporter permease [Nitrospinota bacterium]MDP6733851.1 branched-chain amino acid ABC transporter permease [Gammaproteobacteria bacterium]MDP7452348.1 branched-chain amino acid ABC transporter permease [Arenicellales bacterium]MDP7516857.1 branched-chain amino acid ABC transporter permease [Arenicellales bacterium]|tara:strand:- start:13150 stop:14106 length:957 start_codon:yes stop_codon:yes gene_type:complete